MEKYGLKYNCNGLVWEANEYFSKGRFLLAAEKATEVENIILNSDKNKKKISRLGAGKYVLCKDALLMQLKSYDRGQFLLEAEVVVKKLIGIDTKLSAEFIFELAINASLKGRVDQAQKFLKLALKRIDERHILYPALNTELGVAYEQVGLDEKALRCYRKVTAMALQSNLLNADYLRAFNRLAGVTALDSKCLEFLNSQFVLAHNLRVKADILFVKAKNGRKNNAVESEIKILKEANSTARLADESIGLVWKLSDAKIRTESIKRVFNVASPSWLEKKSPKPELSESVVPIFVLAMPRSGTTLLEQLLGGHSKIGNTGESRAFSSSLAVLLRSVALPGSKGDDTFSRVQTLKKSQLGLIVTSYLQYQALITSKKTFTDKQLANVLWVGLIANLFPSAKFIYLIRERKDNCVSLMQQNFQNAPYSTSVMQIMSEYNQYKERMEHWKAIYPDRVLFLDYGELVTNTESTMREALSFLGLGWDDRVLDFSNRSNSVRTPSVRQVRRGVNTLAQNKWVKYKKLLMLPDAIQKSPGV